MAENNDTTIVAPVAVKPISMVSAPTFITLIKDLGFPIAVAVYFLFKDYMFTGKIIALQEQTNNLLQQIVYHVQK